MKKYRLKNTGYSSKRYGNCEVCNKHVSEVFYQVEEKQYKYGWTQSDCNNLYGHKECLIGKQA